MDKFEKGYFVNSFYSIKKGVLLGRTKVYGAKARSSEELKFLSSQPMLIPHRHRKQRYHTALPSQPTPNREQNQACLNYAEMRRRKTVS
jgi:hypothetical protein